MKRCKYCAEEIQTDAVICKHCGKKQKKSNWAYWVIWIIVFPLAFVWTLLWAVWKTEQGILVGDFKFFTTFIIASLLLGVSLQGIRWLIQKVIEPQSNVAPRTPLPDQPKLAIPEKTPPHKEVIVAIPIENDVVERDSSKKEGPEKEPIKPIPKTESKTIPSKQPLSKREKRVLWVVPTSLIMLILIICLCMFITTPDLLSQDITLKFPIKEPRPTITSSRKTISTYTSRPKIRAVTKIIATKKTASTPLPTKSPQADIPAECVLWSKVTIDDTGKQMCIYGIVTNLYFDGKIIFDENHSPTSFEIWIPRLDDFGSVRFNYFHNIIGECVIVTGWVYTSSNAIRPVIILDETTQQHVKNCP